MVLEALRSRGPHVKHKGHMEEVKMKQRCHDAVWWPHIDQDVEGLAWSCACCLLSGETGQPNAAPATRLIFI